MKTTALMIASAATLGVLGVACSFLPAEILASLGAPTSPPLSLLLQLWGAISLGFAAANWTAKDAMIGGIYSRPLSLGNFFHFAVGAVALLKFTIAHGVQPPIAALLLAYAVLALGFGRLLFGPGAPARPPAS